MPKTGFRIITNPLRRCMPSISARPVRKRHMSCCIRIMFRAGCIKNSDLAKKTTCKKTSDNLGGFLCSLDQFYFHALVQAETNIVYFAKKAPLAV